MISQLAIGYTYDSVTKELSIIVNPNDGSGELRHASFFTGPAKYAVEDISDTEGSEKVCVEERGSSDEKENVEEYGSSDEKDNGEDPVDLVDSEKVEEI
jgi:hypothetical protein